MRKWPEQSGPDSLILNPDNWNDYGYTTTYTLWARVDNELSEIGDVKFARPGLETNEYPLEPGTYEGRLPEGVFSLGQRVEYYEKAHSLSEIISMQILEALNDIALNRHNERASALEERATEISLLRSVSLRTVEDQFSRIATGGSRVVGYAFEYNHPIFSGENSNLTFTVDPESNPPTNIHVLIGRNGTGKTKLLNRLARSTADPVSETAATHGRVADLKSWDDYPFSNVVSVSFSAFDEFDTTTRTDEVKHAYVGLRSGTDPSRLKSSEELESDLERSLYEILAAGTKRRFLELVEILNNDPNFSQFEVSNWPERFGVEPTQPSSEPAFDLAPAVASFREMSSGHKIVLLTVAKLVELTTERSLVLIDEPESHLHPPLLSAFMRILSELLNERNGVAIVATHSPVVLQEVPSSCVWILERINGKLDPRRPDQETFGESLGLLTRDVFGLEVSGSGFHREISEAVQQYSTYEEVIGHFGGRLGTEARGLVQLLLAHKSLRSS
ncbi:AAA family ATPase [Dietzia maris]